MRFSIKNNNIVQKLRVHLVIAEPTLYARKDELLH